MSITPQQFVEKWENVQQKESAVYSSHFEDVCRLVGHPTPTDSDATGETFSFQRALKKQSGAQGFADVWYRGKFAVEYKGKDADLKKAYEQLLQYREALENPPLLVVCDIAHWEIHTNFPGTQKKVYAFDNQDITKAETRRLLHALFEAPESLHPHRTSEQVTKDAARAFEKIADNMRQWQAAPDRIAHFLTKLVFCLFAEDVQLLPNALHSERGIFSEIAHENQRSPKDFTEYTADLFKAMADGGKFLMRTIPYFNGALFDDVAVEELSLEALAELVKASNFDWSSVEPAIFGTLFERSLDPRKRAQLGAHYTSRDDILLIVEPVLMQPLRREWDAIKAEAAALLEKSGIAVGAQRAAPMQPTSAMTPRQRVELEKKLTALREKMLNRLRTIKVLDPACGSGNFLYVSLQLLKNMEKEVLTDPVWAGLQMPFPEVHPRQMYGIELDPIAHALASIVVWIGYIQWHRDNGYTIHREPILEQMHDNIRRMDAIMNADGSEPEWEAVDVIVGNPPFLGGKKLISEFGEDYIAKLRKVYEGRLPGFSDFVTFWFERARTEIEKGRAKRVGLLATNSIAMGTNLPVMKHIKETGDIFMAWSDRDWILDGAAVRVSMVGFDNGTEKTKVLDGLPVKSINPDLTADIDLTQAKTLQENQSKAFIGTQKSGSFDITAEQAKELLEAKNPSGLSNGEVVRPWVNGEDIVQQPKGKYVIYFARDNSSEEKASQYEAPFEYVKRVVQKERTAEHFEKYPFWLHWRPRPEFQVAVNGLSRYIITPRVSKHRIFAWVDAKVVHDSATVAIARDDDYFFGVLHSRLHEAWSLRMGTSLEDRPRYTPTTTFETFPFPFVPGKEDRESAACQAIAAAAKTLHEERAAWLAVGGKKRTLTNLYNALNVFRGKEKMKIEASAGDFAPRLDELHQALDKAVCAAYGWDAALLDDEEAMLRKLLELNLARA